MIEIDIPQDAWDKADTDEFELFPKGLYYLQITAVKKVVGVTARENDYLEVTYTVLCGRHTQECNNKTSRQRFYLTPAAVGKLANVMKRVGLQRRGTPNSDTGKVNADYLVGAQLIVELEHEQREGRKGKSYTAHSWRWGKVWPIDHEEAPQDFVAMIHRATTATPAQQSAGEPVAVGTSGVVSDDDF